MPPEENNNSKEFSPIRVDIDPVFKGAPSKPISQSTGAYNLLNNQQYTPTPAIPSLKNVPPKKTEGRPILRTYKDDIAEAIQANHLSSINIAVAENERMHDKINFSEKINSNSGGISSKTKTFIIIGIIIIITGIIAVISYLSLNKTAAPVKQTQTTVSILTTEYRDELNTNNVIKDRFVSALSSKINDIQIPANNIYNAYITSGTSLEKRIVTANEFVSLTNFKMPDIIKRSLSPEFMIGMLSSGQNLPFVIFKTSSFENTYAGMLEWEKYLEKDFLLLFRLGDDSNKANLSTSLTPSVNRQFEDGVINNKDVRLLRDQDGRIIFLYGIIDKNTIVITVNEVSFKELLVRLNKEKGLKR